MKYLHRQNIEGKSYEGLVEEGVNFDYIVTENIIETGYTECTDDISAWRSYFKNEGLLGEEYSYQTSMRYYLVKNRWYGPNSTYGMNYYHCNTNYDTEPFDDIPVLSRHATGILVKKSGFLNSIKMYGRFNYTNMNVHFAVNAQTKTNNSTYIENRILYHDNSDPSVVPTSNNNMYLVTLDINREVHEGEVITLLANRSDNRGGTKYFYTGLEFIFE